MPGPCHGANLLTPKVNQKLIWVRSDRQKRAKGPQTVFETVSPNSTFTYVSRIGYCQNGRYVAENEE